MKLIPLFIVVSLLSSGCTRNYFSTPTQATPPPETPKVITSKIQFRVSGNALSVKIRYSNERDGLIQLTTTLPYFTSFNTTSDNLFLSLEVTPITFAGTTEFPFLNAQIFVNGDLFREASSTSSFLNTISVDGTWRR